MASDPGSSSQEEMFLLCKKLSDAKSRLTETEEQNSHLLEEGKRLQHDLDYKNKENEALQQSNYSLNMKLTTTQQTLQCCAAELEGLQEEQQQQAAALASQRDAQHEREVHALRVKFAGAEQRCETAEADSNHLKEQLTLAHDQLKEAQDALVAASIRCQALDDTDLHNQIASLTRSRQELESRLSRIEVERDSAGQQLAHAQCTLERLGEQLEEKECSLTTQYNDVERLKEEVLELQQELELCKLSQKDPNVKGNSLFAEVEDNRLFLEQQVLRLQEHYKTVVQQYKLKVQHVSRLKLQVASLLALSGSRDDSDYVSHLNESLRIARSQLNSLRDHCLDMERRLAEQADRPVVIECQPGGCTTRSSYYMKTFEANQKELTAVRKSLQESRFHGVMLSDQLLQLQRKARAAECSVHQYKSDAIRLNVQLQEIQASKGIFTEPAPTETRLEKLPGYSGESEKSVESAVKPDGAAGKSSGKIGPPTEASDPTSDRNNVLSCATDKNSQLGSKRSPAAVLSVKRESPEKLKRKRTGEELVSKSNVSDDEVSDASPQFSQPPPNSSGGDKENALPSTAGPTKESCPEEDPAQKRPKKSVRLQDTVHVQECDGKVGSAALKPHDGSEQKPKRPMRRLVPPPPQATAPDKAECKQQ